VPDEATVRRFRHLLERNGLGEQIFKRVGKHLQARGFRLSAGTIVDVMLISAPTSTKNQDRA
jgi:transposase, IS5 family